MKMTRPTLYLILIALAAILIPIPFIMSPVISPHEVRFKKIALDREFRSEGVAVADVNRDGKPDVLAGNLWYEAPNWTPREIQPVQRFDGATGYSNSFINFTADLNNDGWPDQIRIDHPGLKLAVWNENPKGKNTHWIEHTIFRNACNESPAFAGLFADRKSLVFSFDDSQMAWFEPASDPLAEFIAHPVSDKIDKDKAQNQGVFRYSHGLGIGDINGDGRNDILVKSGYWLGPKSPGQDPWQFVSANLGEDCAQMHVYDVNGDGLPDVLSSSAHGVGIWWHEQRRNPEGGVEFIAHTIDNSFSQSHALELVDLNGDGLKDLVTGKRFWAHGPKGDVNPSDPAVLVWFELQRKDKEVKWIKHEIDNDSGVGTQFTVADLNNDKRPDIVTSNKKGVFVFIRQ
jgi:VCBS repeat protein